MKADTYLITILLLTLLSGCTAHRQLTRVKENHMKAEITQILDNKVAELGYESDMLSDTTDLGETLPDETIIMNAERDEQTGEIILKDVLQPAAVRAKIRNVPERNGKIEIAFEIIVPESLLNSEWQTRFYPEFVILDDTLHLEPVYLTGREYREKQLRGYELYERFLSRIIDPNELDYFLHKKLLEIFIERNLPVLAQLKRDSAIVCQDDFFGKFGVTYQEAENYYRNRFRTYLNRKRISEKEKKFNRYVSAPFGNEKLRLDSVITDGQSVIYRYTQVLNTRPNLRKVDMFMDGSIMEEGQNVYIIPRVGPLTFYISSVSGLAENRERYLKKVISRNLDVTTSANIDFSLGSDRIEEKLNNNIFELERIRANITGLLQLDNTVLDSITVRSSCSPEGSYAFNAGLSRRRGQSICRYLADFIEKGKHREIGFISTSIPEDWERLEGLICSDSLLQHDRKLLAILRSESGPDQKEEMLRTSGHYEYLKEIIFPRLRAVDFSFYLHRTNMLKDTVHTTIPDTVYRNGLRALKNRDYKSALRFLRNYNDYNTAVCLICLDFNDAATEILENLEPTAKSDYLLAIAYSRKGKKKKAVIKFMEAVKRDSSMKHRGNLDPEISELIDRYRLTVKKIENGTI